ncbi:MAG: RloB domain-containing protein [Burkholderiales bacterium]|nr:RloB domain-containing protein [Burkholderiales bacterium]
MGKDNQPKHRQATRQLRRRAAQRKPADRLLIVCEGAKTEPLYLGEIRQSLRLPTANVQVQPAAYGTAPLQVVNYAEALFRHGNRALRIEARTFDRIVAVFDRDDHHTYHTALEKAASLDGRMTNDEKLRVPFDTVVSVPCFELWLLLHFEDVFAPLHRDAVLQRLKAHLPGYAKGQDGHWAGTRDRLAEATARATALVDAGHHAHDGQAPFTAMHALIDRLLHLKNQAPE